jgi:hypothetical protein
MEEVDRVGQHASETSAAIRSSDIIRPRRTLPGSKGEKAFIRKALLFPAILSRDVAGRRDADHPEFP